MRLWLKILLWLMLCTALSAGAACGAWQLGVRSVFGPFVLETFVQCFIVALILTMLGSAIFVGQTVVEALVMAILFTLPAWMFFVRVGHVLQPGFWAFYSGVFLASFLSSRLLRGGW